MSIVFQHLWVLYLVLVVVTAGVWRRSVDGYIEDQPGLEVGYRQLFRGYVLWLLVPVLAMGFGVLMGWAEGTFDFFLLGQGGAFVTAWQWGIVGLLAAGTYWIFFGGGDRQLERHPGMYPFPRWKAAQLRLFWLGILAWVGLCAAVSALELFRGGLGQVEKLLYLIPLLVLGAWFFGRLLQAALSGWSALATHYTTPEPRVGEPFRGLFLVVGNILYSRSLVFGSDTRGLHLSLSSVVRFAHPPLFIPWADLETRRRRFGWFDIIELRIEREPAVSIFMSQRLAFDLLDAGPIPVEVEIQGAELTI